MRPGTYSQGHEQAALELMSTKRERNAAKTELARLNRVKAARDQEAAKADARRSKRHISKGDKDAKARIDLAVFTGQDGKAGKRSVQMDARLAQTQQRLEAAHVDKTYDYNVWLDTQPSKRRLLVELAEGCLAFGSGERIEGRVGERGPERLSAQSSISCLRIPRLQLGPTDHIAITGINGTGKTTLIRALLRAIVATDLEVLSVPQELSIDERQALLKRLVKLPQSQRGQVLSIVAQLNSDPGRLLDGNTISPGEARKLMLALGVLSFPQIIVMDEPTNHLDLASTEALERMLAECPCALLLVSHDNRFLSSVTSILWHIEPLDTGAKLRVL
jgi:ATPase subunit of ABC transporter with duplicated ATPase domains